MSRECGVIAQQCTHKAHDDEREQRGERVEEQREFRVTVLGDVMRPVRGPGKHQTSDHDPHGYGQHDPPHRAPEPLIGVGVRVIGSGENRQSSGDRSVEEARAKERPSTNA